MLGASVEPNNVRELVVVHGQVEQPRKRITGEGAPAGDDRAWRGLYRAGAVAAASYVVLVTVPIVLVFAGPVPPDTGEAVLAYIADHRVAYLTELICFVGLAVPALLVFAALGMALRHTDRSVAAVGGLLGVASEVIALSLGSSPQSLHGGLVVLSDQYAATGSTLTRTGLASAADALIAATNAVSWAGILTAAAILTLSLPMRRAGYGAPLAWLGIVTGVIGIPAEALRPLIGAAYAGYGLLLPVWFGAVGWRLWRVAREFPS